MQPPYLVSLNRQPNGRRKSAQLPSVLLACAIATVPCIAAETSQQVPPAEATVQAQPAAAAPAAVTNAPTAEAPKKLEGKVTISVPDSFGACLSKLIDAAEKNNADYQKFDQAVAKYDTVGSHVRHRTGDALNYTLMYKGISPSSEAGDVILGEKDKLKSLSSAKYLRQRLHDELQLKVLSNVMQLAMALGNADEQSASAQLKDGQASLAKLVGDEQAKSSVAALKTIQEALANAPSGQRKSTWTIGQTQKRVQAAVQTAASADPIVQEIQSDVHKYNHHKTGSLVAHRMVRVALSTISLAPSIVGPAAQAVMFGFLAVSGGTEQDKLLSALYLDKRLSSRAHLLTEEAHLAFENYQLASLTNNKLLMACSEQLIKRMTSNDAATRLLSAGEYKQSAQAPQ